MKVFLHLAGVLVADMEIASEGFHDDGIELLWDLGVGAAWWDGFGFADLFEGVEVAFADEQALSREDLVQDDADAEDIGALIEGESLDLFGGHIAEFTFEDAGLCTGGFALGFGDAKVDDFDIAIVGDKDVLGRDVAVDDMEGLVAVVAFAVGVIETFAGFGHDIGSHLRGDDGAFLASGAIEDGAEIAALDVFHGDKVGVIDFAEFKDLSDVGMAELDSDLGFVDEHGDEFLIFRDIGQDALEGDGAFEALDAKGFAFEDLSHATDGDAVHQEIFAERNRFFHGARP